MKEGEREERRKGKRGKWGRQKKRRGSGKKTVIAKKGTEFLLRVKKMF